MGTPAIVVDARCVGAQFSGISRYVLGLLSGFAALKLPYAISVLGGDADLICQATRGSMAVERVACPWAPWSSGGQLLLPGYLARLHCQVYHCPYVYAPIFVPGTAKVVTVHDLIPNRYPEMLRKSWKVRLHPLWNAWCRAQCASAQAVVTVSHFSRQELLQDFSLPPTKVHCIYNGVQSLATTTTVAEVRQRFGLQGQVISYIGRHDPYKNIATLLRAFGHLCQRSPRAVTLVIGGALDPRYPEARQLAESLGLGQQIVFTDYLDDEARVALLRASSVFVFVSRYEGFGLPPLEAMAEGIPVIASTATSLPEVLGEAALLVAPDDVDGLALAMHMVLDNATLAQRLGEAGRKQAAQFTWTTCATAHVALYESLLP